MKKPFGKIIAAFLPQKEMPWRPQATTIQGNFPCLKRGQNVALIVSPRIGDVIFCTPAIHMLKNFLNPGEVYVIALSRSAAEVFENSPDIDLVHITEDTRKLPEKIANADAVLDLYNNKKSHYYLREITKPHHLSPRSRPTIHQSRVATDFVSKLIGSEHDAPEKNYRLYPSEPQKKAAERILHDAGATLFKDEILIGFHIGTYTYSKSAASLFRKNKFSKKSWSPDNYLTLADLLISSNKSVKIVLTGTSAELELAIPFSKFGSHVINIIGKTTVLELKAAMEHFKAFVVADTGPLHIASSTTTPIVYLASEATCKENTGPYPPQAWHHTIEARSMDDILPTDVFQLIQKAGLAAPQTASSPHAEESETVNPSS